MSSLLKLDPTSNYWETTQNCPVQKTKKNQENRRKSFSFFFLINKQEKARDDDAKVKTRYKLVAQKDTKKKEKMCHLDPTEYYWDCVPIPLIVVWSMMSVIKDSTEWCELRGREETSSCRRRRCDTHHF